MGKTVCINCGSTISSDVDECPECGKDPDRRERSSISKAKEGPDEKESRDDGEADMEGKKKEKEKVEKEGEEETETKEEREESGDGDEKDEAGSETEAVDEKHADIDISKAMETLEMIDDETYEVKGGDSSSLIENIRGLAPKKVKRGKDEEPSEEEKAESDDASEEEAKSTDTDYECPLCGTKVEEDAEECPGCGAVFEE